MSSVTAPYGLLPTSLERPLPPIKRSAACPVPTHSLAAPFTIIAVSWPAVLAGIWATSGHLIQQLNNYPVTPLKRDLIRTFMENTVEGNPPMNTFGVSVTVSAIAYAIFAVFSCIALTLRGWPKVEVATPDPRHGWKSFSAEWLRANRHHLTAAASVLPLAAFGGAFGGVYSTMELIKKQSALGNQAPGASETRCFINDVATPANELAWSLEPAAITAAVALPIIALVALATLELSRARTNFALKLFA